MNKSLAKFQFLNQMQAICQMQEHKYIFNWNTFSFTIVTLKS